MRREETPSVPPVAKTVPVRVSDLDNARAQRKSLRRMTECELQTGLTVEEIDELHRLQRDRVRARWGLAA